MVVGRLSDLYAPARRRELGSLFIVGLAGALLLYIQAAPTGPAINFGAMALVGFFLFGPDSLISGATAQEMGGPRSAATAAGMINGMGSVGAVLQGRVTSVLSGRFGWNALYYFFVGLALVAAAMLRWGSGRKRVDGDEGSA